MSKLRLDPAAKEALQALQTPGEMDVYLHLLDIFVTTSDKFLSVLQSGHHPSLPQLREMGHSWRNNAMAIGAQILGDLCADLEAAVKANDTKKVDSLIKQIEEEYLAVKAELKTAKN